MGGIGRWKKKKKIMMTAEDPCDTPKNWRDRKRPFTSFFSSKFDFTKVSGEKSSKNELRSRQFFEMSQGSSAVITIFFFFFQRPIPPIELFNHFSFHLFLFLCRYENWPLNTRGR
jgi:hypothetical protein